MRHLKFLLLIMVTGLAACQSTPPPAPPQRQLSFGSGAPLVMAAEAVEVIEQYQSPGTAPNVEQEFDMTPAGAVRQWATTRLRADGTPGIIRVTLLDGRVTRDKLATTSGLKGLIKDEQEYRYNGRIQIRIDYQPATSTQGPAQAHAEATGTFTVPEGQTLQQLEKQMFDMVQQMILRIDLEIQASALRHMQGVVR